MYGCVSKIRTATNETLNIESAQSDKYNLEYQLGRILNWTLIIYILIHKGTINKTQFKLFTIISETTNSETQNGGIFATSSKQYYHITPLMKQLHWLPISQRIIYKIVLITYKSLNGLAPHYINNMLKPFTPSVNLRSSSKGFLTIHSVRLVNYGERSFSYAAPKLWDELQEYIGKRETLPIFKTRLMTYLFKQ
jgi:hypothetical protein